MTDDWKTYAADWLRRAAIDDVGNIYLLGSTEVPECDWGDVRRDYSGYTHPSLDVRHEALLAAKAEWKGRGFCAVIDSDLPPNEKAAVAAHELAHYLADKADVFIETLQVIEPAAIGSRPRLQAATPTVATPEQNREYHDLRFNRAACHLVHRLRLQGFNLHPDGLGVCGYVLSESPEYYGNRLYAAFQGEYTLSGSIVAILRSPAPVEAIAVWDKYTQQRDECLAS